MKAFIFAISILVATFSPSTSWGEVVKEGERMDHIKNLVATRGDAEKTAQLEHEQFSQSQNEVTGLGVRMVQGLLLCAGVFFVGIFAYRKITGVKPQLRSRRMRVVERIPLAPKTSLILAEVNGKEVLLAIGEKVSFINLQGTEEYDQEMELLCQDSEEPRHSVS